MKPTTKCSEETLYIVNNIINKIFNKINFIAMLKSCEIIFNKKYCVNIADNRVILQCSNKMCPFKVTFNIHSDQVIEINDFIEINQEHQEEEDLKKYKSFLLHIIDETTESNIIMKYRKTRSNVANIENDVKDYESENSSDTKREEKTKVKKTFSEYISQEREKKKEKETKPQQPNSSQIKTQRLLSQTYKYKTKSSIQQKVIDSNEKEKNIENSDVVCQYRQIMNKLNLNQQINDIYIKHNSNTTQNLIDQSNSVNLKRKL